MYESWETRWNLNLVTMCQGKFQEAADLIAKARKLAPGDYRVLKNLSNTMAGIGNITKARKLLNKALPLAQSAGDTVQVEVIIKNAKLNR